MHARPRFNTLLLCLIAATAVIAAPASVTIKDLRLFIDQDEYYIKGVAYSPSPLAKTIDGQTGGTGLCTPKPAYATGSFSNVIQLSGCLSEDYFDGTVYTPGPSGGWWNGIWERDFPLIASMGANTIRIYHTYPITQAAIDADPRYNAGSGVQGSNHIPFMNLASSYNLKVVFPLFADSAELDQLSDDWVQLYIRYLIDEVGDHPALLMYTFGNELQFWTRDASYAARIDSFVRYARAYQMQKWNRYIPITVALIDYPPYYDGIVQAISFDIITTNAGYRGFDFSDLWSGSPSQGFSGMYSLSCQTGKPVLIGEMGVHNTTPVFDVPSWFGRMWSDVINHKAQGAIGGFLFSFQEEHWKGVTPAIDWTTMPDVNMGVITLSPGSGTYPVDIANKKNYGAYDFAAVTQGFTQNVWAQDGPNTMSAVSNNFCKGASATITAPQLGSAVVLPTATSAAAVQPSATSSGSSGSGASGSTTCGAGLSQCGNACYKASQYCCVSAGLLYPADSSNCPSKTSTSAAAAATTSAAASPAATSSTTSQDGGVQASATSSDVASPSQSSPAASTPSASQNNGASTTAAAGAASSTTSQVVNTPTSTTQNINTVDRQQGSAMSLVPMSMAIITFICVLF